MDLEVLGLSYPFLDWWRSTKQKTRFFTKQNSNLFLLFVLVTVVVVDDKKLKTLWWTNYVIMIIQNYIIIYKNLLAAIFITCLSVNFKLLGHSKNGRVSSDCIPKPYWPKERNGNLKERKKERMK